MHLQVEVVLYYESQKLQKILAQQPVGIKRRSWPLNLRLLMTYNYIPTNSPEDRLTVKHGPKIAEECMRNTFEG